MMAMPHAFIHGKAYTQQYGCASTALALPEQSAHHDSVPVLAKGLAKPIIILLEPRGRGLEGKKKTHGRLFLQSDFPGVEGKIHENT